MQRNPFLYVWLIQSAYTLYTRPPPTVGVPTTTWRINPDDKVYSLCFRKENNAVRPPHPAYHPASVCNVRNSVSRPKWKCQHLVDRIDNSFYSLSLFLFLPVMPMPVCFSLCWWLYSWRHFQFSIELSKHVILHICLRWLKGNVKSKTVQTNSKNTKGMGGGAEIRWGMGGWKSNFLIEIGFFAMDSGMDWIQFLNWICMEGMGCNGRCMGF